MERDRRAALELEIEMLKKRVPAGSEVQSAAQYQQLLCSEVDSAVCSRQMLLHGPDTVERFAEFSMSAVITELQASCPQLYRLVQQLGCSQRNARGGRLPDEELKGVMAVCTLLNARSARVKGLQLMISLMLVARATGRQVHVHTCIEYAHIYTNHIKSICTHIDILYIYFTLQAMTLLNHAGVCMSYTATWDHLLALTQQANLVSKIQSGHWIWAYDNVNIHRTLRHERQGEYYSNDIYLYMYMFIHMHSLVWRLTKYY